MSAFSAYQKACKLESLPLLHPSAANLPAQATAGIKAICGPRSEIPGARWPATSTTLVDGRLDVGTHLRLLGGRFQFLSVLGEGVSAQVVLARDTYRAGVELVAIKIMKRNFANTGAKEARALRWLESVAPAAAVPRIQGCFMFSGHVCLVLPRLYPSLLDCIVESAALDKAAQVAQLRGVAFKLLATVAQLHVHGVVHADLKPDNVLLTAPLGGPAALDLCVVDFGACFSTSAVASSQLAFEAQTLPYRAPEVVLAQPCGPPMDVWSIGCILAELMLHRPIFPCHSPAELLHQMAEALGEFPGHMRRGGQGVGALPGGIGQGVMQTSAAVPAHGPSRLMVQPSQEPLRGWHERLSPLQLALARVHPQAGSLVSSLLTLDPSQRPSAAACLQHPFLNPVCPSRTILRAHTAATRPRPPRVVPETAQRQEAQMSEARIVVGHPRAVCLQQGSPEEEAALGDSSERGPGGQPGAAQPGMLPIEGPQLIHVNVDCLGVLQHAEAQSSSSRDDHRGSGPLLEGVGEPGEQWDDAVPQVLSEDSLGEGPAPRQACRPGKSCSEASSSQQADQDPTDNVSRQGPTNVHAPQAGASGGLARSSVGRVGTHTSPTSGGARHKQGPHMVAFGQPEASSGPAAQEGMGEDRRRSRRRVAGDEVRQATQPLQGGPANGGLRAQARRKLPAQQELAQAPNGGLSEHRTTENSQEAASSAQEIYKTGRAAAHCAPRRVDNAKQHSDDALEGGERVQGGREPAHREEGSTEAGAQKRRGDAPKARHGACGWCKSRKKGHCGTSEAGRGCTKRPSAEGSSIDQVEVAVGQTPAASAKLIRVIDSQGTWFFRNEFRHALCPSMPKSTFQERCRKGAQRTASTDEANQLRALHISSSSTNLSLISHTTAMSILRQGGASKSVVDTLAAAAGRQEGVQAELTTPAADEGFSESRAAAATALKSSVDDAGLGMLAEGCAKRTNADAASTMEPDAMPLAGEDLAELKSLPEASTDAGKYSLMQEPDAEKVPEWMLGIRVPHSHSKPSEAAEPAALQACILKQRKQIKASRPEPASEPALAEPCATGSPERHRGQVGAEGEIADPFHFPEDASPLHAENSRAAQRAQRAADPFEFPEDGSLMPSDAACVPSARAEHTRRELPQAISKLSAKEASAVLEPPRQPAGVRGPKDPLEQSRWKALQPNTQGEERVLANSAARAAKRKRATQEGRQEASAAKEAGLRTLGQISPPDSRRRSDGKQAAGDAVTAEEAGCTARTEGHQPPLCSSPDGEPAGKQASSGKRSREEQAGATLVPGDRQNGGNKHRKSGLQQNPSLAHASTTRKRTPEPPGSAPSETVQHRESSAGRKRRRKGPGQQAGMRPAAPKESSPPSRPKREAPAAAERGSKAQPSVGRSGEERAGPESVKTAPAVRAPGASLSCEEKAGAPELGESSGLRARPERGRPENKKPWWVV